METQWTTLPFGSNFDQGANSFIPIPANDLLEEDLVHNNEEKEFQCGECQKSFSKLVALKSHETVHKAEKIHTCLFCQKGFARRHDMLRHERTVHSALLPLTCGSCSITFSTPEQLADHCFQEGHTPAEKLSKMRREVGKKPSKKKANMPPSFDIPEMMLDVTYGHSRKMSSGSTASTGSMLSTASLINSADLMFADSNKVFDDAAFRQTPFQQAFYSLPVTQTTPSYHSFSGDSEQPIPEMISPQKVFYTDNQFSQNLQQNMQKQDMNDLHYPKMPMHTSFLGPKSHHLLGGHARPSPLSRELYSVYDKLDVLQDVIEESARMRVEPFNSLCDGLVSLDYSIDNLSYGSIYTPPQLSNFKIE